MLESEEEDFHSVQSNMALQRRVEHQKETDVGNRRFPMVSVFYVCSQAIFACRTPGTHLEITMMLKITFLSNLLSTHQSHWNGVSGSVHGPSKFELVFLHNLGTKLQDILFLPNAI